MSRKFQIPTDPYDEGVRLYARKDISLNPGLTTLIGCNGSGKSTLLMFLKDQLQKDPDILVMKYDDRYDGGHNLMEKMGFLEDFVGLSTMMTSSEGERIYVGLGHFIGSMRREIRRNHPKEVWILMDAVGSGLSIDKINEVKDFADIVVEDNAGIDVYFIVSTNEYEFADGTDCIDVTTFKHMTFNDYADYRNYILETAKRKEKRNEKINAKQSSSR
jgi:hypothetical protein